jgi:hypothetical protein
MKLKLKGRWFDTIGDIQTESQSARHSDRKGFTNHSKNGGDSGTVYMQEGTTLRVMAADRTNGEFYFYSISPEYFGYTVEQSSCCDLLQSNFEQAGQF